jgi:hypothetical protein
MEAFSTFRKALLTQFMVLLTVDLPDFGKDVFMTIYVVRCPLLEGSAYYCKLFTALNGSTEYKKTLLIMFATTYVV